MKRILIFSLVYYPRVAGGAEVALKELTDRLGGDFEFDMITLRKHAPAFERVGKVNVYRVGFPWRGTKTASSQIFPLSKILFPFFAFWKASSLQKTRQYDAAWSMMAAYAGFAALFFKLRYSHVPLLVTLQEGDPIPHIKRRAAPAYPLFRMIFTKADMMQAISHYLADFGRSMGFAGPMEVVPNGVEAARFAGASPTAIGKKEGEVWLIHTGRLVRKNALDTVIRALPLLEERVHFFSIGDGPSKDALVRLARGLGVSARVHFHPYVLLSELPGYLKACDIFIRPSRSEGMGNSFIEAMAAGLPVIATQEGGIADFLFDAKRNPDKQATGWAVDKDSPEQIAEAARDIIAHPEEAARVTSRAREMVLEKYDWGIIAEQMKRVFGGLLAR